jgi:phosphoglycolate phosphatase
MTAYFFEKTPFCCVLGQRDDVPKKPDPFQALAAAQEMGVCPADCIFLGDSAVDMQTARRAGMMAIGAGWGFRPAAELHAAGALHVIDHPLDFLALLDH